MEATILQGVRNVPFHLDLEIFNVCIGKPGIVKLADVETVKQINDWTRIRTWDLLIYAEMP